MSDQRFHEIDEEISSLGWWYNHRSGQFEAEGGRVDWQDAIVAMPDLSLSEWQAYEERKRSEHGGSAVLAFCDACSARR